MLHTVAASDDLTGKISRYLIRRNN